MLIDSPCHAATVMNAVLLIDLLNQNFKIHIFMHGISYHFKEMKGNFSNYSVHHRGLPLSKTGNNISIPAQQIHWESSYLCIGK